MAAVAPTWDDSLEERLAALLDAQHGGEPFDAFIRRVSPRHTPPRHIAPLIGHVSKFVERPGNTGLVPQLAPQR